MKYGRHKVRVYGGYRKEPFCTIRIVAIVDKKRKKYSHFGETINKNSRGVVQTDCRLMGKN